jgi:STE24 endopeptidase
VLLGTALGACGAALGVGLLALIVSLPGVRRRAGVTGIADPRAVALLLALTAAGSFLASPIENTISRAIEARADLSALDATRDPDAFVELQKRLATSSLQQPAPPAWNQFWFGTHPTAVQRIGMARTFAKASDEVAR